MYGSGVLTGSLNTPTYMKLIPQAQKRVPVKYVEAVVGIATVNLVRWAIVIMVVY